MGNVVDLSKLKVGDKVKLRNGQVLRVTEIAKAKHNINYDYLLTIGNNPRDYYTKDGRYFAFARFDDKDIVEIIPKENSDIDVASPQKEDSRRTKEDCKAKPAEQSDPVNHPSHYTSGGIECIAAIKASMTAEAYKGYLKGNTLKYLWRYEKKVNPVEDLKKARTYLEWLIKENENG